MISFIYKYIITTTVRILYRLMTVNKCRLTTANHTVSSRTDNRTLKMYDIETVLKKKNPKTKTSYNGNPFSVTKAEFRFVSVRDRSLFLFYSQRKSEERAVSLVEHKYELLSARKRQVFFTFALFANRSPRFRLSPAVTFRKKRFFTATRGGTTYTIRPVRDEMKTKRNHGDASVQSRRYKTAIAFANETVK